MCLNGPAARKGAVGDEIIIISYGQYEDSEELRNFQPMVVQVDKNNKIKNVSHSVEAFNSMA
jgi:aspartate 1-decarboxylase